MRKEERQQATSTELTGGTGFTYEDRVVAYYLAALLREERAAGLDGVVKTVAVQQAGHDGAAAPGSTAPPPALPPRPWLCRVAGYSFPEADLDYLQDIFVPAVIPESSAVEIVNPENGKAEFQARVRGAFPGITNIVFGEEDFRAYCMRSTARKA